MTSLSPTHTLPHMHNTTKKQQHHIFTPSSHHLQQHHPPLPLISSHDVSHPRPSVSMQKTMPLLSTTLPVVVLLPSSLHTDRAPPMTSSYLSRPTSSFHLRTSDVDDCSKDASDPGVSRSLSKPRMSSSKISATMHAMQGSALNVNRDRHGCGIIVIRGRTRT